MTRTLLAAAVALVAAVALSGPAAAAPTVVDYKVDGGRLTVGDTVTVTVSLVGAPGTQVELAPGTLPPTVELIGTPEVTARKGAGEWQIEVVLTLAVFQPGELLLPPLELSYVEATGERGSVVTPASVILVESVLDPGLPPTLRGLKPQASLPGPSKPVAAYAGLAATSVALVLVVALIILRRARRPAAVRPVTATTVADGPAGPEDEARAELGEAAALLESAAYEGYYARVSSTVRRYLTQRFGFPAFALTTSELQRQMVARGMDRWQARIVGGLLDQCDAVVYAQYRPASERADADLTAAYEIIEMSRPAEEPVAATEAEPV